MTDPFAYPLYPHQNTGVLRLASKTPTYLGFDMGIGKSRTFIEAAKVSGGVRFLIICPLSAVLVWRREIALWDPGAVLTIVRDPASLRSHPQSVTRFYFIITHGTMSQKDGDVAKGLQFCPPFDMTAIDEAHGFNAPGNNRVHALRHARKNLGFIVPLSGTPMKNHAGDLYTLTQICAPNVLKTHSGHFMSRNEFEEQFCIVSHKKFGSRWVRVIEGSKNLGALKSMLKPFMLRVRKEDVLPDLPPITWALTPVDLDQSMMPPQELVEFERAMIALAQTVHEANTKSEAFALALSRVSGGHLMALRRKLGLAKLKGACEYLVDMLDSLPDDRKVLVYATHIDVIKALATHLGEWSPAILIGETSAKDRVAAVDKFLRDPQCRVFIGNIHAAGTGLTLVGPTCKCSDVVFVESSWTPMDNAQAACRIHRIGQKDGVVARMLTAAGTIDDLIQGILARKASEFTQLFDTKGATP
jgi:SWI/SNF-related matrix-associated actin-dependent regulator of chromatin subfamily A-like protein 1